jgi:hypothetical protein
MKTKLQLHLLLLTLLSLAGFAHAQGTAISYQGRLNDGGSPATGLYDFTFHVFDAEVGGTDLAGPLGPLPYDAVPVINGLFNVSLDFGPDIFSGPARWLEISVRTNGVGDPSLLAPRTPLLPTPYAIFAGRVANGTVTADQLNSGGVRPAEGQFLSYDGANFLWRDRGIVEGDLWLPNGTDAYYNGGKVGIGTMTPANKLTVYTPTLEYGLEHTDGDIRLGTFVGRATGYLGTLSNHKLTFFANDNGLENMTMTLIPGGNVGIGTANPVSKLHVFDGSGVNGDGGTLHVGGILANGDPKLIRFGDGDYVHLGENGQDDTLEFKAARYHLLGGDISYDGRLAKLDVADSFSSYIRSADLFLGHSSRRGTPGRALVDFGTELHVNFASDWSRTVIGGANVSVCTLTIRGGCDLAEPFPMKEEKVEKGSVVVIDEEHPGRLKLSTRAYDTQVAGIVSGANGINPGISLKQEGVLDQGEDVALTGRVYVKADASGGAIKPGDLLTTSHRPGHAMKVTDHDKSQGAILGKAMSALQEGTGMVLVLVTLQ